MARKASEGNQEKIYFGETEEQWFLEYINETDKQQKDLIYFRYLKDPFEKMVDLVIKKYVNIPTGLETFEGVKEKMYSHLGYTLNGYQHKKNTKAYSYFSNVLRNYGWQIIRETTREKREHLHYDDVSSQVENDTTYSYELTDEQQEYFDLLFLKLITEIETYISKTNNLTTNELLVGNALIEMFNNREFIFDNLGESKKFDKMFILTTLREKTGLTTKEIRDSMVGYKSLYYYVKKSDVETVLK